jgi:N-acyl-D-aspartate/D-glutamate deacylase
MCLEGSFHPLAFHPAWQEIAALPLHEKVKALRTRELQDKFKEVPRDGGFFEKIVLSRLWKFFPVTSANIDYEPSIKTDSVEAISAARRIEPMQLIIDHMLTNEGKGMIYLPFFNYTYGDLSMTHDLLAHPHTRNGLSDAGAHCGAICDGGMPTFMLTHWVRDRQRGPRHSLEHMVHRQTRATALVYGLKDRGLIAPGMRADLNLIDFEKLSFDMPQMVYDFPANGRRLVQHAKGYMATICNGTQTVDDDNFTGELPGELLT